MVDIRLFSIFINEEINIVRYFKSEDTKIWISLDDILASISFSLDLSNYTNIMNYCYEGEVKLHKRTRICKNTDNGYISIEDKCGTDVYISLPTIDILAKKNLSYNSNKELKKVRDKLYEEMDRLDTNRREPNMIIDITTVNQVQKPLRLSLCEGENYMSLKDIIEIASFENRLRINDYDIEKKMAIIVGEENFKLIYFTDNFNPLYIKDGLFTPFISHKGLQKLIEYPEMDEYLIKIDLARINNYINKYEKAVLETISCEKYNKDMYLVKNTKKKENNQTHEIEKENKMNELKLLHIEMNDNNHKIHYFKSKKEKLCISLDDIYSIIYTYYNRLVLSDIMDFCKESGRVNACEASSMYKTAEGEDIYVKVLDYYEIFVDFSTIDKLAKKYSVVIPYGSFDKLKNAIRDNFEELAIEITEDEIEKRIEAVKKEIDSICKLQKTIKDKKK